MFANLMALWSRDVHAHHDCTGTTPHVFVLGAKGQEESTCTKLAIGDVSHQEKGEGAHLVVARLCVATESQQS